MALGDDIRRNGTKGSQAKRDRFRPGMKVRIPFRLNETDIDSTVLLLTDLPAVRLAVEAPDGSVMDPGVAAAIGAVFAVGTNMAYYRFSLPVALGKQGAHSGNWHALLEVDERTFKKHLSKLDNQPEAFARARAHGARYSLNVHATSNLRMAARLSQSGLEPGAMLTPRVVLTEYGLPVERRAAVRSELQRPDGTTALLALSEIEPGVFETTLPAPIPGLYRFRVLATGATFRGLPFTREQLLTGAVFQGGDRPLPTSGDDPRKRDEELCRLIECLLENDALRKFAAEHHLDLEALARCVRRFCEERLAQAPESGGASRRKPPKREGPTKQELTELLSHPKMGELLALLTEIVRKEKM
jgi:hypothetical protein